MEWVFGLISTAVGIVMGAASAGIPLYFKLRRGMIEIRERERQLVESYYGRAFERVNKQIDILTEQNTRQEIKINQLQEANVQCIKENVKHVADREILRFQIQELQKRVGIIAPSLPPQEPAVPTESGEGKAE